MRPEKLATWKSRSYHSWSAEQGDGMISSKARAVTDCIGICLWHIPVMVPCTTVPFFSSMDTVSLFSFIRNLK